MRPRGRVADYGRVSGRHRPLRYVVLGEPLSCFRGRSRCPERALATHCAITRARGCATWHFLFPHYEMTGAVWRREPSLLVDPCCSPVASVRILMRAAW